MANPLHLELLSRGTETWNSWRRQSAGKHPNLARTQLLDRQYSQIDFGSTDLSEAVLNGSRLLSARFVRSDLSGASLRNCDLRSADFSHADLRRVDFAGARMEGAILENALLGDSTFLGVNLSEVVGLESARHAMPSWIGIDVLYLSEGRIPDCFLRGAGVAEDAIEHLMPSIRASDGTIQFDSCFISYSHRDDDFARRLHSRLRQEKMRVWFADEDMKGGETLHDQIFKAIQVHDRILLVLSDESMRSQWVVTEIRKAFETENREKRRKLFPIRLVDFARIGEWSCFDADSGRDLASELRQYFIPDFSQWKDHDKFEAAFARLLRDLRTVRNKSTEGQADLRA